MMSKPVTYCLLLLGATVATLSAGCNGSFYLRDAKSYRDDTTKLLASKNADMDTCYDNAIKAAPGVKGKVTVQFTVEEKSGRIINIAPIPAKTNAPQPLVDCVINGLNGLVLNPPDQNTGIGTFEYNFEQKKAK